MEKQRRDSATQRKKKSVSRSASSSDEDYVAHVASPKKSTFSAADTAERPPRPKRSAKRKVSTSSEEGEPAVAAVTESLDNIEKKMAEIMGEGAEEEASSSSSREKQHWQLQQSKPKTREEIEAAKILKTDKATKELYGFDDSDIAAASNRYD